MNKAEKEQLFQERVMAFYAALANVFMEEKDRIEVPQIKLKSGDDLNEVVAAMMGAEMAILNSLQATRRLTMRIWIWSALRTC